MQPSSPICAENTTGIKEKVIKITIIKIRLQIYPTVSNIVDMNMNDMNEELHF